MIRLFCEERGRGLLFRWATGGAGSEFCSSPVAGSSPENRFYIGHLLRLGGPHRRWGHFSLLPSGERALAGGKTLCKFQGQNQIYQKAQKRTANVSTSTFAVLYLYVIPQTLPFCDECSSNYVLVMIKKEFVIKKKVKW